MKEGMMEVRKEKEGMKVGKKEGKTMAERKLLLYHYRTIATRRFSLLQRFTSGTDAARTKAKTKRFFMAVGDSDDNMAWAAPQAHFA